MNVNPALAYLFLFLLSLLLILMGFQGSAGKVLAVLLAPGRLRVISGDEAVVRKVQPR